MGRHINKPEIAPARVFNFIKGFHQSNGESPTTIEIAARFQISTSTVDKKLRDLEAAGLIQRIPAVCRGIRILEAAPQ